MGQKFVPPRQFFELLFEDQEFCDGLGKVFLAAGMLETNLRNYLQAKTGWFSAKSTLGQQVKRLKDGQLLSSNGEIHFDDLATKRNYLAHSIFDLFSEQIDETVLPRNGLVKLDVELLTDRVHRLSEDFLRFADLVLERDLGEEQLL